MKSIVKILIAITCLICLGCGSNDNKASENPFQKYANEPIFLEGYQKYFVTEYCKEIDNFNSEYLSLQKELEKRLSKPDVKAVPLKENKKLFSDKIEYSVTSDDKVGFEYLSYIGDINDNKPDGIGIMYLVRYNYSGEIEMYRKYAGHFKDGKYDGYGIIYRIPIQRNLYVQEVGFITNPKYINKKFTQNGQAFASKIIDQEIRGTKYNYNKDIVNNIINKYEKLTVKKDNSMSYEGDFKDGLKDGYGILYSYSDFIGWIEPGKKEYDELKTKLIKDSSQDVAMQRYFLEDKLLELEAQPKIDYASMRCQGRLYIMAGEFDNNPDGDFLGYTQNDTGDNGYKLFECEAEDDELIGKGKLWNSKGEIVFDGDAENIMKKIAKTDFLEYLTLKDYKLKDDYLNIKL